VVLGKKCTKVLLTSGAKTKGGRAHDFLIESLQNMECSLEASKRREGGKRGVKMHFDSSVKGGRLDRG